LITKEGRTQDDWDSGLMFPSAQILTTESEHRIYFEARPGWVHHEYRFDSGARLGTATWHRDRIVGIRRAHTDDSTNAGITTKPFHLRAGSLWLQVDASSSCARVLVEVLKQDGSVWNGRSAADAVPLAGVDGWEEARWQGGELLAGHAHSTIPLESVIRLRITLVGDALLYAFQLRSMPDTADPTPRPVPSPKPPPPTPPPRPIERPPPPPPKPPPSLRHTSPPPPSPPPPSPAPPVPEPVRSPNLDPPRPAPPLPTSQPPSASPSCHPPSLPLSPDSMSTDRSHVDGDHAAANDVGGSTSQHSIQSVQQVPAHAAVFFIGAILGCVLGLHFLRKGRGLPAHQESRPAVRTVQKRASSEDWVDLETELPQRRTLNDLDEDDGMGDKVQCDSTTRRNPRTKRSQGSARKSKRAAQDQVRLLDVEVTRSVGNDDPAAPAPADETPSAAAPTSRRPRGCEIEPDDTPMDRL